MANGAEIFRAALAEILKRGSSDGGGIAAFREKAGEIAKRDGCAQHEALRKARIERPDLYRALEAKPIVLEKADAPRTVNTQARAAFASKVRDIAKRDGVAEHVAMSRTRNEHPELFLALQ